MDGDQTRSSGDDRDVQETRSEVREYTENQREHVEAQNGNAATTEGDGGAKASTKEKQDPGSTGVKEDVSVVNPDSSAQPAVSSPAAASPTLASATTAKKFNSLSVAKQFFQKASPTTTSANVAALASPASATSSNLNSQSSGSRLSTSMPSSRLTTAKLSGIKPSSPGWAQLPSASGSQGGVAVPSIDAVLNSATSTVQGENGTAADPGAGKLASGAAGSTASPRLVTALARSTSPHVKNGEGSKGSPGLRNAALSGLGRSTSPATAALGGNGGSSTTSRAPWAALRTSTQGTSDVPSRNRGIARPSEFPTAAEAAQAKAEAERREKAAAAEAAARADQALQKLESFRGTTLGEGNQWDEMDDDLDEVMDFDGSGPAGKATEEPVTKEERFKDVGHDRSWPQRSGESRPSAPRKIVDVSAESGSQSRPYSTARPKVETMSVHSGEGISLDTVTSGERPTAPWGYPSREHKTSSGSGASRWGDESAASGGGSARHAGHQSVPATSNARGVIPTPAAPSARAWGPLAQRQASLNPNAPKTVAKAEPSKAKGDSEELRDPPASVSRSSSDKADRALANSAEAPKKDVTSPAVREGRALPPHLAATAAAKANAAQTKDASEVEPEGHANADAGVTARPYGSLIGSNKAPSSPNVTNAASEQAPVAVVDQRDEMLSAAERARKRRQAEEEERQKERERALAKAQAIEQKMREEQERANREAEQRRQEAQKARKPAAVDTNLSKRNGQAPLEGLVSPQSASDESKSWRRSGDTSSATKAFSNGESDGPKVLLRRPSASSGEAKSAITADATATIPTGPRAVRERRANGAQEGGLKFEKLERDPRKVRGNRVEIVAPTDAGPDSPNKQRLQKASDANTNSSKAPLTGVLKASNTAGKGAPRQTVDRVLATREEDATRNEVMFDPVPVWNRFVVRVSKRAVAHDKSSADVAKAQRARVVRFQKDEQLPSKVDILSWDPPLPALSMRTLSRDDQFFPKKYRKGIVISNVVLPRRSVEAYAADRAVERQREAAQRAAQPAPIRSHLDNRQFLQSQSQENPINELERAFGATTLNATPAVKVPSASAMLDGKEGAFNAYSNDPSRSLPRHKEGMGRSGRNQLDTSQMLNEGSRQPVVSLRSSTQIPTSRGLSSTTWGENSLTFAGLGASTTGQERSAATSDERKRIKDVWSSSNDAERAMHRPVHNSLEGITDEFPSTMSMMNALDSDMADEMARNNGFAGLSQHVPTIVRSTKSETTHLYSPLDRKTMADSNAALTSSSSPSYNGDGADGSAKVHDGVMRVRNQSPSSSMRYVRGPQMNEYGNGQSFVQRDRTGVRSAFGPYAYPDSYSMQQTPQYQSSAYGGGYGGGGLDSGFVNSNYRQSQYAGFGGNAGNRYALNQARYRGNGGTFNGLGSYNSAGAFESASSGGLSNANNHFSGNDMTGSDYSNDRTGYMTTDGSDYSHSEYASMQNAAGSAAAGWPLDSPGAANMSAVAYGSSPNTYNMSTGGGGYQSYVPQQHRQQQHFYTQQRPTYHGRTSSSNYRSYNNGGGGNAQYPRQMGGRGANYNSGHEGTPNDGGVGVDVSGEHAMQSHQDSMHQHSSSLQATAKPFQAGKTDSQARSERPSSAQDVDAIALQQQQAGQEAQSAQQYSGYNAAVW